MALAPDAQAYLDAALAYMAEQGAPFYRDAPLLRAREINWHRAVRQRGPVGDPGRITDIMVPTRGGDRPAKLVRPRAAAARSALPLIVYFHGGGYVIGGLEESLSEAERLADATGASVVSFSYRLAPEHPFPAFLEDGLDALDWARSEASSLGADPARIGLAGCSAGAGLAAAVVRACRVHGRPGPRAAYLMTPWLDLTFSTDAVKAAFAALGRPTDLQWFADCATAGGAEAADPYLSPALHPAPAGFPPTVVLTAAEDFLREEAYLFVDRLKAAGTDVLSVEAPGMPHAYHVYVSLMPSGRAPLDLADQAYARRLAG